MTESARELAKPIRDTIAAYLQQSCGFTLAAGIANAENIIAALSAAGFAIVPVEPTEAMIREASVQMALFGSVRLRPNEGRSLWSALLTASKENT